MKSLVMRKVTAVDLVNSIESANKVVSTLAPTGEGTFRRVWVGGYKVLKRAKSNLPVVRQKNGEAGANVFNIVEAQYWEKYKGLGVLAKVEWVSGDGKYLVMERLDCSDAAKCEKMKELFSDFWVDGGISERENGIRCMERVRVYLHHMIQNRKHGSARLLMTQQTLTRDGAWDKKVNLLSINHADDLLMKLRQLPGDVAQDLHYNNWGVNDAKELKVLDYAGL